MTAKKQARVNPIHKNDKPPVRNDQCLQEIWHMLADLTERHANAHGELIEWLKSIDQRQVRMNNALKCVEQAVEDKDKDRRVEEDSEEEADYVWVIRSANRPSLKGTDAYFGGIIKRDDSGEKVLWVDEASRAARYPTQAHADKAITRYRLKPATPKGHLNPDSVGFYSVSLEEDEDDS